ncbi:hypothetical protein N657DRAFT_640521 [Parathielavia appendiculata]|uniref:Uncharacterized protein n=1 Tax=Parathielavia appendiculata TaxID=2587402 RepID=A0AAN6U556_9PEZI|nr:hypothetical protein N657DRAFT_640521 [Parathielavia appendiculata]
MAFRLLASEDTGLDLDAPPVPGPSMRDAVLKSNPPQRTTDRAWNWAEREQFD